MLPAEGDAQQPVSRIRVIFHPPIPTQSLAGHRVISRVGKPASAQARWRSVGSQRRRGP